jgi:hypothetical protein
MFRISLSLLIFAVACAPDIPVTCTPPADPDVVDPCGSTFDGGVVAKPGTPDAGQVPTGSVSLDGGTVDRLWFATTGDTRPSDCDQTNAYPTAAIAQIATAMKALRVQFTVDLGDHMYVCNGSDAEAQQQMGFYMTAVSSGPANWWMTMGNHECGSNVYPYACFTTGGHDANFSAYMSALKRPLPYYFTDVVTTQGTARFVFIADDSWNSTQSAWLDATLAQADSFKYTIVVRHHPVQGSRTGTGPSGTEIPALISKHKYTLILTAHNHDYEHDLTTYGGRSTVVGLGGAGGYWGFATLLQNDDGTLTFVQRDANGNPVGTPWTVTPQ